MTLPTIASFARSVSILEELNQNNDTIQTIYEPGTLNSLDAATQLRYTGILRDLRCKVLINSLPEQEIPNISVEMSESQRYQAIQELEWNSPRFELWIYFQKDGSTDWHHLFSVSLTNQTPFYTVNLLPYLTANAEFLISPDIRLGASIKATGSGFPDEAVDSIVIFGSVKEEMDVLPSSSGIPTQSENHSFLITHQPRIILSANTNRKGAVIVNTSDKDVYISLGNPLVSVGQGIALVNGGGTYSIDYSNLYQGDIWAVGDTDSSTQFSISGNEST